MDPSSLKLRRASQNPVNIGCRLRLKVLEKKKPEQAEQRQMLAEVAESFSAQPSGEVSFKRAEHPALEGLLPMNRRKRRTSNIERRTSSTR